MITIDIAAARNAILDGGVIAAPTEAVYGLSCDPWDVSAVERLLQMKQRERSKGLILVAGGLYQFTSLLRHLRGEELEILESTWPGPVTWLVPAPSDVPEWISGGQETIALRVTAHAVMAELCREAGKPLVSTSANITAKPPATTPQEVMESFPEIDGIVEGELGGADRPTEIRDLATGDIVRPG